MKSTVNELISRYCACLQEWNASFEKYAKSVGLSFTSLSLLREIYEREGCTQKALCDISLLPKQTVNAVITAFYKKGWISLTEQPEDRRNKSVNLTAEGQAAAKKLLLPVYRSEEQAMNALTPDRREALISLTEKYISNCGEVMRKELSRACEE